MEKEVAELEAERGKLKARVTEGEYGACVRTRDGKGGARALDLT